MIGGAIEALSEQMQNCRMSPVIAHKRSELTARKKLVISSSIWLVLEMALFTPLA